MDWSSTPLEPSSLCNCCSCPCIHFGPLMSPPSQRPCLPLPPHIRSAFSATRSDSLWSMLSSSAPAASPPLHGTPAESVERHGQLQRGRLLTVMSYLPLMLVGWLEKAQYVKEAQIATRTEAMMYGPALNHAGSIETGPRPRGPATRRGVRGRREEDSHSWEVQERGVEVGVSGGGVSCLVTRGWGVIGRGSRGQVL